MLDATPTSTKSPRIQLRSIHRRVVGPFPTYHFSRHPERQRGICFWTLGRWRKADSSTSLGMTEWIVAGFCEFFEWIHNPPFYWRVTLDHPPLSSVRKPFHN
jgi:hypothetical protein